jgi:SP family myo-inositol transporter-like MFS transporter 13
MTSHSDSKMFTSTDKAGEFDKVEVLQKENVDDAHAVEDEDPAHSIEQGDASWTVWLITFTVAMGGFLFGYDTGVISAVLVNLKSDLGHPLSSNEQELITSITSGGALIGSLIAGLPADRYGRKLALYIGCVLFVLGSVLQASAFSLAQMTVGRLVIGMGVGSAAMIIVSRLSLFLDLPPLTLNSPCILAKSLQHATEVA